jgi:hypothetical protein
MHADVDRGFQVGCAVITPSPDRPVHREEAVNRHQAEGATKRGMHL